MIRYHRLTDRREFLSGSLRILQSIQGAIAVFLGLVKEGKSITIWGTGDITRDYIYIKDVVPILIKALQVKTRWKIYNVGSGKGTSLNELIKVIGEVTNRDITVNHSEGRSIDVLSNVLDISRIREEFGFYPKIPLPEGIRKTWEWLNRFS